MIKEIKAWCNKPYFLIDNLNIKLSMVVGVGFFTCLFLLTFQPYGMDKVIDANPFLIIGYGSLVSFSLFISYFLLPKLFPAYFSIRSWTVQKEATFLMLSFLIISITNYFYHNTFIATYLPKFSFLRFVSLVFSIGVFPVLFIIFLIERYLYKKHNAPPTAIIEKVRKETLETVSILSENIKEAPFIFNIDDIIFAQSNNNYTTIVYIENNTVKQKLIRITLKKVDELLSKYAQFIRCHRSFLVNKNEILKIEGNSRSLQVHLKYVKDIIPVSRSFPKSELTD